MYVEAFDVEFGFAGVKTFVLYLAFGIAVQSVGIVRAESFDIKVRRSGTDFFIRCKCDTDWSVRNLLFNQFFWSSAPRTVVPSVVIRVRPFRSFRCSKFSGLKMRPLFPSARASPS